MKYVIDSLSQIFQIFWIGFFFGTGATAAFFLVTTAAGLLVRVTA